MNKVLLGASGSSTGFSVATAFRKYLGDEINFITSDIHDAKYVTASIFSDGHVIMPYASSLGFYNALEMVVEQNAITHYIPLLPDEILAARKLNSGEKTFVKLINANIELAELWTDKLKLGERLAYLGVKQPIFHEKIELDTKQNYYVKPRCGVGSKNCGLMNGSEILEDERIDSSYIIQSVCYGKEVTVDCFFDNKSDRLFYIARERLETKLGVCTKARLFYDEKIETITRKIAEGLNLSGTFCYQIMDENEWKVTDINPRPGGGSSMSCATGNDFIGGMLLHAFGKPYDKCFKKTFDSCIVTRQYADFIMP